MQDRGLPHSEEHSIWRVCNRNTVNWSTRPALQGCLQGDLKSCIINPADLETASSDRSSWRTNVKTGGKQAEKKRQIQRKEMKSRKQQRAQPFTASTTARSCGYAVFIQITYLEVECRSCFWYINLQNIINYATINKSSLCPNNILTTKFMFSRK
jgi:hypothetical protein